MRKSEIEEKSKVLNIPKNWFTKLKVNKKDKGHG